MKKKSFVGFSTFDDGVGSKTNYTLHDLELCKRDLLNHFHTMVGERVMMPTFGCKIWDYLFEPMTDNVKEIIFDDARRVVSSDSRLELQEMNIIEIDHGFIINILLYFKPWDVYERFSVDFDRRSQENK